MVQYFQNFLIECFDKYVPLKKIKVCDKHISGLSNETKELMKRRNKARRNGKNEEYKLLRNKCNKAILKEKRESISKRYCKIQLMVYGSNIIVL